MSSPKFGAWRCFKEAARVGWDMSRQVYRTYRDISLKPGHQVNLRFAHDVTIRAPHMAGKDVVYVPTPESVVDAMIELANIQAGETVIDLGSGDGRLCIAARLKGAIVDGVELNPKLVAEALKNAERLGVGDSIRWLQEDLMEKDLDGYAVIFLYLLPYLNAKLEPKLKALKPGTRIVSHHFAMPSWIPAKVERVEDGNIYLWVVK